MKGAIVMDSSAALGVVGRKWAGKLIHVRVGQFWVQEIARTEKHRYRKVKGTENPTDLRNNALPGADISKYMPMIGLQGKVGRAARSLGLQF